MILDPFLRGLRSVRKLDFSAFYSLPSDMIVSNPMLEYIGSSFLKIIYSIEVFFRFHCKYINYYNFYAHKHMTLVILETDRILTLRDHHQQNAVLNSVSKFSQYFKSYNNCVHIIKSLKLISIQFS